VNLLSIGTGWFPEAPGGLERVYYALDRHLPDCGVTVQGLVVGSSAVDTATDGRVSAVAASEAPLLLRWWRFRRAGARYLTSSSPIDLVAAHFALYAFPLLDRLQQRPFVTHFHGPWAHESLKEDKPGFLTRLKAQLESAVYHRADRLIVLSEAFRDVLCERYGVDEQVVRIVPGGVDADRFDTGLSRDAARKHLGWPTGRPVVISVRRLARRMGLEHLIDAVARLRDDVPNVWVGIAGTGPLADALQQRIERHNLEEQVHLLGFVPEEELPIVYRAADLSIVPTTALEGFGLITLESLAAGTPVLVTPIGGLPETVRSLDLNLVLDAATLDAIADGLVRALTAPDALPSPDECQSYVRTHFDWPVIARRTCDVYKEVL